ncbi:MAG: DNA-formamidopyrimidine glycosylase family protein [Acidimicrobiia bacterium]|nr:DNA-formamidopyrimidine glycosylase family protein [Acidimicrobiia bacterium]
MPEGHSIARFAKRHRDLLGGRKVAVASPQGRFAKGAARLDGRKLLDVSAHGKHLFYHWQRAETLHIHLGLYGKFRTFRDEPPPPTPGTRLSLSADGVTIYLAGPTVCELIMPSAEEAIRGRLGPDPLQAETDGNTADRVVEKLSRRSIPIGAAILDQSVMAGLGNIYRAEVLFLTGVNPTTPARDVPAAKIHEIWDRSVELLGRGVAEGKIVTVPGRPATRADRVYVYQRERHPCRRCGGAISMGEMANRNIWWCESCQPRQAS